MEIGDYFGMRMSFIVANEFFNATNKRWIFP